MNRYLKLFAIITSFTLTLIFSPLGLAEDEDADIAAVKMSLTELVAVSEAGNAEAYCSYITDDAAYLGPGSPPIVGKEAICPWVDEFFASWEFSFPKWKTDEVIISGNVAIHRYSGIATSKPKAGGDSIVADRKYMDVLRRGSDGQWRLARHMFNLNN